MAEACACVPTLTLLPLLRQSARAARHAARLISDRPTVLEYCLQSTQRPVGLDCCMSAQSRHSMPEQIMLPRTAQYTAVRKTCEHLRAPGNTAVTRPCFQHRHRQQDQAMPQAVSTRSPHRSSQSKHTHAPLFGKAHCAREHAGVSHRERQPQTMKQGRQQCLHQNRNCWIAETVCIEIHTGMGAPDGAAATSEVRGTLPAKLPAAQPGLT